MEATSVPRRGKPNAKLLSPGHHPTPRVHSVQAQTALSWLLDLLLFLPLSFLMISSAWCYMQLHHLYCDCVTQDLCHFLSEILGISVQAYLSALEKSSFQTLYHNHCNGVLPPQIRLFPLSLPPNRQGNSFISAKRGKQLLSELFYKRRRLFHSAFGWDRGMLFWWLDLLPLLLLSFSHSISISGVTFYIPVKPQRMEL